MREKIVRKLYDSYLKTLGPYSTNVEKMIVETYGNVLFTIMSIVGGGKTKLEQNLKKIMELITENERSKK